MGGRAWALAWGIAAWGIAAWGIAASLAAGAAAAPTGTADQAAELWARGQYAAARPLLRRLALEGDADAMTLLGLMAARGLAGPRDPAVAAAWYLKAAEHDHVPALRALADAFRRGEGVVRDPEVAWRLEARASALDARRRPSRRP
ncbi:MAG: hypothetical protein NZM40_01780 [Sphingomonadaceae bacterium]|nr:hypothetical protein [Sphingomonadaceae bacterium]